MKDISRLKRYFEKKYAKQNNKSPLDPSVEIVAEVNAIWRTVIPDPYFRYSLTQFNGKSKDNHRLLSPDVALDAKKKLVDYCWDSVDLNNDIYDPDIMSKKSIMNKRLREGKNVVIYAPGIDKDMPKNLAEDKASHTRNQKGRTMIAALIMKEAIRQRYTPGHRMDSYDWIDYPVLKSMLSEDKSSLNIERASDWLVVDDISLESTPGSMSYISGLVDPFFISRLKDKLPTIFVFRFNINKEIINIEKSLGVAIHRIVNDPKTHVISLGNQ